MSYIKGKVRNMIFESETGYKIGLFRVKETDDEELLSMVNKTITFTGSFHELNNEDTYILKGEYIKHERYGYQYRCDSYEKCEPEGKDAVVEFLSSSLIKGCGEKTALKIVETLGEDAINKIKENKSNLLLVQGLTEDKATKIYNSIMKYAETDDLLIYLKGLGFSTRDSLNIINEYGEDTKNIIENNIYELIQIIDFSKLDQIYLTFGTIDSIIRIKACIIETMKALEFSNGDTYLKLEEINSDLRKKFHLFLEEDEFYNVLNILIEEEKIYKEEDNYYLYETYMMEEDIAGRLREINKNVLPRVVDFDNKIKNLEERLQVKYNKDQKNAVKSALNNNITIITGGPGTGKTTIINAIVKMYIEDKNLSNIDIISQIALLAPTGRASKKMMESTGLPAQTIHRYLKWNKDKNEFSVNEDNPHNHSLIIVDEVSMIDTHLFDSLLRGIKSSVKMILVGDTNQLPSVGAGLVLNDLILSEKFKHCALEKIYRQSANSYIPVLCKEIREHQISKDFNNQKDDYNFIGVENHLVKPTIEKIIEMSRVKNLTEKDIQILVPMYKGENGIDNLNASLQCIFNPFSDDKREIKIGDVIYRENDKVLQLVNDVDSNVFNGDIGYIKSIEKTDGKDIFIINFDGNKVMYKREDLGMIRHAYAISIHKSQGSEFNHVIMPVTSQYHKMLYNKLIYTGVSRAKKSLVIIGSEHMFLMAVNNDYSKNRKTGLLTKLMNIL